MTHSSDIFQIPTELTRDQLSFCPTSVKSLQEWAAHIAVLQLGSSSQSLFSALLEIAELKCTEMLRFDLIQVLHPVLENMLTSLEKHFFNQGLMSSDRNEQIIELAALLRSHFAKIYIDIAKRSHQHLTQHKFSFFAYKQKKSYQNTRLVAIYYAIRQLSLLLYQQHLLYTTPVYGQWLVAHQLLECAVEHQFYLSNVNQLLNNQHSLSTISQAYAQLVLLDIFDTHQLRPAEIQGLYLCSFDWAKLLQILPKETTLSRYIVDSAKDHPPIFNSRQSNLFKPNIFISTQVLLEHIHETQNKTGNFLSPNEKLFLTPALHFHIQNLLTQNTERRHERYEYSAQLNICFGLSVAHFYLAKGKNLHEILQLPHGSNYRFQSDSDLINTSESATLTRSMQNNKALEREAKQIYSTEILDISINGYRIKWLSNTPANLKTGEFILVQENAQSQWRGAVIRWIKQSTARNLELGLEVIAQEMYPCAAYTGIDKHNHNYQVALLTQHTQLDTVETQIIVSGSQSFREKQTIYLRLGQDELRVYLSKAQIITPSFIRFDFELLNDEQQILIDQFVQQQSKEMQNHDLWEALK